MKLLSTVLLLMLAMPVSYGQEGKSEEETQKWISRTKKTLRSVKKTDLLARSVPHTYKSADGSYRYKPLTGYIEFEDGSWVILMSHTGHLKDKIGHVSVVKTSEGDYHCNRGNHTVNLLLYSKVKIKTLEDFINSYGLNDKKEKQLWKKLP